MQMFLLVIGVVIIWQSYELIKQHLELKKRLKRYEKDVDTLSKKLDEARNNYKNKDNEKHHYKKKKGHSIANSINDLSDNQIREFRKRGE